MTELLEKAVATARQLTAERQDDVARMVLAFVGEKVGDYDLSPEELADLERSDGEVARGEFASDERMNAIWEKYGR